MNRVTFVLTALAMLLLAAGCRTGPPTLAPTLVLPSPTPLPTDTVEPVDTALPIETGIPTDTPVPSVWVRRGSTLRAGPGVQYPVAGNASFGEVLIVYGRCEGWLLVSSDGSRWIIEGKVILDVPLETIPEMCGAPEEPTATLEP